MRLTFKFSIFKIIYTPFKNFYDLRGGKRTQLIINQ